MNNDYTCYQISLDNCLNEEMLFNYIYPNMQNNYYWSNDWSEDFYIETAYSGFISGCKYYEDEQVLLPEIQFSYAALSWEDLLTIKNVRKIIKSDPFLNNYFYISINNGFDKVVNKLNRYHGDNWLSGKYIDLLRKLIYYTGKKRDFHVLYVELCRKSDDYIIAGEIGYTIGSIYTSLTGFCDKEIKEYNNFGKLQLVCLAKILQKNGYTFWNLGHPYMKYKKEFGGKIYTRKDFLEKWFLSRNTELVNKLISTEVYKYNCVDLLKG